MILEMKVMVRIRLTSLFLILLLSLATIRDCTPSAYHGIGKESNAHLSINGDDNKEVDGEKNTKGKWIRKMGAKDVEDEKEAKNAVNSGAINPSDHGGKGEMSLEYELSGKRRLSPSVKFVGLSDYHPPKTHPPKHN